MEASSIASRAKEGEATQIAQDVQDGLFDIVIDNPELEEKLKERHKHKTAEGKAKAKADEADEEAKGIISTLGLEEGQVARCGSFKISKSIPGDDTPVSFTRKGKSRLTISMLGD